MRKIVVPQLTVHWQKVAAALKFTRSEIDTIACNHNGDQKECCVGMLENWINTDKGLKPNTWPVFLAAITNAGLAGEADVIKKSLEKENEL